MSSLRRTTSASLAISLGLVLALASIVAAKPGSATVQILDNCDPASFNAALGDGACVRPGGGLTFDGLIEQLLRKGTVDSWRFAPEQLSVRQGGTVTATNRGGEFHTFTEVAQFGGGCVDEINELLGLSPVPECAAAPGIFFATGVPAGASLTTDPLASGTHLFQCLIHPWQRTTVSVP